MCNSTSAHFCFRSTFDLKWRTVERRPVFRNMKVFHAKIVYERNVQLESFTFLDLSYNSDLSYSRHRDMWNLATSHFSLNKREFTWKKCAARLLTLKSKVFFYHRPQISLRFSWWCKPTSRSASVCSASTCGKPCSAIRISHTKSASLSTTETSRSFNDQKSSRLSLFPILNQLSATQNKHKTKKV